MSDATIVILALIATTAITKAAGPVLVGGRELPPRALSVISLLAPALLAALVMIETFGDDSTLVIDERVVGVGAAAVVLSFRDAPLLAVALAAAVSAAARAL